MYWAYVKARLRIEGLAVAQITPTSTPDTAPVPSTVIVVGDVPTLLAALEAQDDR